MKQEEKQLLLNDLCARLPYGVYVSNEKETFVLSVKSNVLTIIANDFKPYLRPMSSMTEEEVKEIQKINWQFCKPENGLIECFVGDTDDGYCSVSQMAGILDYLNAHHFDYRGLIPMGLALEAPQDMYKTE